MAFAPFLISFLNLTVSLRVPLKRSLALSFVLSVESAKERYIRTKGALIILNKNKSIAERTLYIALPKL